MWKLDDRYEWGWVRLQGQIAATVQVLPTSSASLVEARLPPSPPKLCMPVLQSSTGSMCSCKYCGRLCCVTCFMFLYVGLYRFIAVVIRCDLSSIAPEQH